MISRTKSTHYSLNFFPFCYATIKIRILHANVRHTNYGYYTTTNHQHDWKKDTHPRKNKWSACSTEKKLYLMKKKKSQKYTHLSTTLKTVYKVSLTFQSTLWRERAKKKSGGKGENAFHFLARYAFSTHFSHPTLAASVPRRKFLLPEGSNFFGLLSPDILTAFSLIISCGTSALGMWWKVGKKWPSMYSLFA